MARRNAKRAQISDNQGGDDPRVYHALALPEQALAHGGVEVLRLGVIRDELYVSALPAFQTPGQWGEVLAEVVRRLAGIYAAQKPGFSKKDVTVEITQAFAAEMGAKPVNDTKTNNAVQSRRGTKKAARPVKRKKR